MEKLSNFKTQFIPRYVVLFTELTESRWQYALGYNAANRVGSSIISQKCDVAKKYSPINHSASIHENLKDLMSKGVQRFAQQAVICYYHSDKTLTPIIHLKTRQEVNKYYHSLQ